MKRTYLLVMATLALNTTLARVEKLDKIPKEERETIDQIKIEKGGLLMLEQHLRRNKKYNQKDDYTVEFLCDKKSARTLADCRVIRYRVLNLGGGSDKK